MQGPVGWGEGGAAMAGEAAAGAGAGLPVPGGGRRGCRPPSARSSLPAPPLCHPSSTLRAPGSRLPGGGRCGCPSRPCDGRRGGGETQQSESIPSCAPAWEGRGHSPPTPTPTPGLTLYLVPGRMETIQSHQSLVRFNGTLGVPGGDGLRSVDTEGTRHVNSDKLQEPQERKARGTRAVRCELHAPRFSPHPFRRT